MNYKRNNLLVILIIDLIKDNDYEYEAKVKGKKDKMKKSSFEEIVLEFIKDQREFNKKLILDLMF